MRLHPRHRIDIASADLAFAAAATVRPGDRRRLAADIERLSSQDGGVLACLSARSAFDLVLAALDPPAGGEVLMSAVTIPDMGRIVVAHGLVPVPVDLDPATLGPRLDLLEELRTDRTAAVVVAHLFGGRVDVGPTAAFAARHRLPLVEDCAQSFAGVGDMGSAAAAASLFSFGPIKTATALGGGLVHVRDAALLARVRRLHDAWPVQPRAAFARRVARMGALTLVQRPGAYGLVASLAASRGRTLDRVVSGSARSFPSGYDFRRQPSAPLLAVLRRRLRDGDGRRLSARAFRGENVARALDGFVDLPGMVLAQRTHWLFPVAVDDPPALVTALRAGGFDASTATSALVALPPPEGRPEPAAARAMLERLVFLPVYPELPEADLRRLLDVVRAYSAGSQSCTALPSGSDSWAKRPLG